MSELQEFYSKMPMINTELIEVEQLRTLCEDFHIIYHWLPCPSINCDNNGVIATEDGPEPCQWCNERSKLLQKYESLVKP